MLPLLITLSVIFAVLSLIGGIYLLVGPDLGVEERLEFGQMQRDQGSSGAGARVSEQLNSGKFGAKLNLDLNQAGLQMTPAEFMMINGGLALGGLLIGLLFTRNLVSGLALALLVGMLPRIWLNRQKGKRIALFQDQLPDVLSLIVGSLRAGYGLVQAMKLVAQEMPKPSADEYQRVVEEISLGLSLQDGLNRLVERMESDDLMMVVTAINIQNEVGGNLGNILETIAGTIRERVKLQGEVRTMTSMQRATGYMLAAMPCIVAVILLVLNPGYMTPLLTFPWLVIPIGAMVSMGLGLLLMNKMTELKF
jgi:tight adherence protein B